MMRFAAIAAVLAFTTAGGGGKLKWKEGKQFDAALAEAKSSGQPLMVYFTAEW